MNDPAQQAGQAGTTTQGHSAAEVPMSAEEHSSLVDTAISHCEKLRRVLELEAWIHEAENHPILAHAAARWQAERAQLIEELQLSDGT